MAAPLADTEAVFWDIGGVILDTDTVRAAHRRFVERLLKERALEADVDAAVETWRRAVGDYFRERDGTEFRPARRAYAHGVETLVGGPLDETDWRPLMRGVMAETLRPIEDAPAVARRIGATDRHQGIVSDIDAEEGRWILDQFGVREAFGAVTTSEDVGRTKPDPAVFEAALEAAAAPSERTVMIGDRYAHDIEGAARHGIRTVAFGADDGPATDHQIDAIGEFLSLLGIAEER